MKKWQRSIRRILAVTMAVLLLCNNTEWTVLRAFATGEETPSSENTEAVFFEIEPKMIITKLPEIETSAMSMAMFAFRGVQNVLLAEGNHAKWIERLDLSGAEYAVDFYDWLIENSDNDGINDALIDPTANSEGVVHEDGKHYYLLKEITGEAPFTFEKGATDEEIKAVADTKLDEVINGNYDGVSAYATAVYSAFDRDYPAVFWLSGASSTVTFAGGSYTCDAENGTGTVSYNQQIGFLLKDVDQENEFDIRATDYLVKDTITAAIGNVNTQVNAILDGQKATIYDNIIYFNEWLTTHNCYNSDVENIGHDGRECTSALMGSVGTEGPVCEGYARAFKVLCDKVEIPCVLVNGPAGTDENQEAHMWNYVQIDGKWYAVDVTWNDPVVQDIEDAVSNYERTEYLLVGRNTSIDGTAFAESHVMTNIVTLNGAGFINEPQIEDTAYEVTASCTAPTAREGLVYNGTEQELVIAGEATGGTMQYSLEKNGTYSTTIPVALNAGSYDVWYKVIGEGNYADTEPVSVQVAVAKATPTAEMFVFNPPADLTYTTLKKTAVITTNKDGMGEITVKYYKDDVEIAPINAGTYTVKIAVAEGRNYTAVTNLPINTFTINKAQATITVETTPIEVNLGDAAFNLNATENNTDDEAALTYASSNDAVVRVSSDGTVTVEGVGTATITVSLGASTNYEAATSKEINITVNWVILSEMEINKNYLYSRVNADRIDLAAMLTEDCGTVEYGSVTDEGQLIFAGESARPNVDSEGILTYTFEAGQVGDTGIITVVAETQNYGTITIKVNITLIDLMAVSIRGDGEVEVNNNTLTYGEKVSVLTFIPVEFVDEDGNVVEGTLAWQEPNAVPTVGTSEVAWVFTPEDDAFALVEGTVSIVVNKANSVVTAAPTPKSGLTYNGDVQQLINEGTATGGEMQYSLDATTWNTTIPTAKDAGTYTVYYKVAGDANHNDIEQKTIKVTIAQKDIADASVDFNESFIYDGTAHEPTDIAVVLNGNPLTEDDYTISGYANNINAGTASITIAGKGNCTGTVTKNFTISKASASAVVAPTATNISYGQSLAHATLSDNAWSWVDETIIPVSSNDFDAYIQVDDSNYDYTGVQGYDGDNHRIVRSVQVIVNKADITITAKSYSIKTGDTMPAFEYEVTGLPNGEVLPVAVSVSCAATNSSTAGTYDITVSGPISTDLYVITYVPGTLEITRNAQTITAGDVTLTYGDADKKITATTDGDGTFTYTVAEGSRDVISVASDGTITTLKAGEATVLITASETGAYTKTEKTIKVIVNKATLSVSSAEAADRAYDGTKTVDITAVGLNGVVGTDVVSVALSGVQGILSSANAGTYDIVSLSGLSLTGAAAGNYILPENAANVSLRREVTISKIENAPNMPAATMNVPNGVLKVGGATLPEGWTWQDADKDTELEVGVVCNAVAVYTGADAGNYANVTVTIAITRAQPVAAPSTPVSTPVSTPAPEPNKPFIQGEAGKNGWDVIRAETGNAKTGDTVVVNMNGATEVPGQVFDDIKGKDVTVTLDLGNGVSWTINGKTITADNVSDINFGVKIGTVENPVNTIPVDIVNRLTGARKSVNISLSHNGEFGLKAILNIDLGKANAGLFANLFYYDKAKRKMEFIWADEIGTNGMAHLLFTHASDYTIVLDKEVLNATGGLSPNTGDSANPWAMVLLMGMFFSVGAGTLWIRSRKDEMAE